MKTQTLKLLEENIETLKDINTEKIQPIGLQQPYKEGICQTRQHGVKRFEQQEKQTNTGREITCQLLVGKSIYKQRKILSSKPHRENTGK